MALDVGRGRSGDVDGVGQRGVVGDIVGKGVELDPAEGRRADAGDGGEEVVAGPGGRGGEGGVDGADVVGRSSSHGSTPASAGPA